MSPERGFDLPETKLTRAMVSIMNGLRCPRSGPLWLPTVQGYGAEWNCSHTPRMTRPMRGEWSESVE